MKSFLRELTGDKLALIIFMASIILTASAHGQELSEQFILSRTNAIGGAFTAIANDENAAWANPAGIVRIRKARSRKTVSLVKLPSVQVGANSTSDTFLEVITADNIPDQLASKGESLASKPVWSMASGTAIAMFDFNGIPTMIGAYSHATIKAVLASKDSLYAKTDVVSDVGGILSLAVTNRSNRVSWGLNVRSVGRYAYQDNILLTTFADSEQLTAELTNNANLSSAIAIDTGFIMTMADFWYPTIGVAIINLPLSCKDEYLNQFSMKRETVCGTVFSGNFSNPDATSTVDPSNIKAGISISPRITRKFGMRIAVDIHNMHTTSGTQNYGLSGIPFLKKTHFGIEFYTGNPLTPSPFVVGIGYSQSFWTAGLSARLPYLSLELSSFARDTSTTDTPVEDRRYMAGVAIDF
ncbi:MAG: hypothetical protein CMP10_05810 [Zetaproteobacteria bacterium]|nr:hypothetical protein [Pseudobdellovibrionaceae bacterium]